jgi:lipopolysaccharide transport protein LptA
MAASSRRRFAAGLACSIAFATAIAQDREQLPIQLVADGGLRFDSENGVVEYFGVTITQGQVRIKADRAMTSGATPEDSRWQFSGAVRITMPDSALASDTAEVRFAGGEIQSAAVTGSPATFEQKREDRVAQGRANRIAYDLTRSTVEFTGDAWLKDARTEVAGETLTYNTATERVNSDEPVKITIQPDEKPAEAPKPDP